MFSRSNFGSSKNSIEGDGETSFHHSTVSHFGMLVIQCVFDDKSRDQNLAKTRAHELAPRNIHVNVVSPGSSATPMFSKLG
jgi:hypothetical protein